MARIKTKLHTVLPVENLNFQGYGHVCEKHQQSKKKKTI